MINQSIQVMINQSIQAMINQSIQAMINQSIQVIASDMLTPSGNFGLQGHGSAQERSFKFWGVLKILWWKYWWWDKIWDDQGQFIAISQKIRRFCLTANKSWWMQHRFRSGWICFLYIWCHRSCHCCWFLFWWWCFDILHLKTWDLSLGQSFFHTYFDQKHKN